jgi:hypothetical protein
MLNGSTARYGCGKSREAPKVDTKICESKLDNNIN